LERHGCKTLVAENVDEALEICRRTSDGFLAVLTDLQFLDKDGLTLATGLREVPGFSQIPLVVLASHSDPFPTGKPPGIVEVLIKPIDEQQLMDCLRRLPTLVPVQPVNPPGSPRLRVLVAEDNPVNQKVAALLLKKLNYLVRVVANGREAVEALNTEDYDVILMDCQMPEMDGFEATRAIRAMSAPEPGPPIIALTANAFEGEREKCLSAGMNDYLAKPIKPELLKEKLAHWTMHSAASQRP
jgi:CheY-like chemotaxis protein